MLDANAGVEPQTETVWRQADRYKVPRIVFVNKMDKIGASFGNCVDMIMDRTGAKPCPIQLPIGSENAFEGMIDLITMEEWIWQGEDLGATWTKKDIRSDLLETAQKMRSEMIEIAVEMDDSVMEKYLDGEEPDEVTLRNLLRKGTLDMSFVPVLCGSAFKNKGVQPLLDAVIDYLPSPSDLKSIEGTKVGSEDKLFGSITNSDLADAISKKVPDIEKKHITIPGKSIKRLGKYIAKIRIHREVSFEFPFEVISEKKPKK